MKNIIKIIRKKMGTEPSSAELLMKITDEVKKSFKSKERLWVKNHFTSNGEFKIIEEIIEYDPSNIYLYINLDKLIIYHNTQNKNNVEFLIKNIYNKINKK
jgi:hypothetical protein